jgi:hypothetical protein
LVPVVLLGKSFDTSCPLGPWLTTKDAGGDPQNLKMQLRLNGELRQDVMPLGLLRADDPRRGGTAQVLRTLVASRMLGWKLPQTRDGYAKAGVRRSEAAE